MIYYKEICSVECVCVFCMLLVAVASVAVLVGAGGVEQMIGRSCFTAGLHSWRTSRKLNTNFPL